MFHKRIFPPLGHRIIKTAVAVFICLLIHAISGFRTNVGAATVAAIICMQPYVEDSKTYAYDRIFGTFLGAAWALAYLLSIRTLSHWLTGILPAYLLMALFTILAIYSTVVIKKSGVAGLTAIIFVSTVAGYPNVQAPLQQTLSNLAATIIGTGVAVAVNIAHLPRKRHPELLFFVRTKDLVPDRYKQIPSSVHIALDHLYKDGAKICLVSHYAPAFIISQMGLLNVNAPAIIMDGAALYDIRDNRYLDVIPIPHENADRLRAILAGFGVGCNIYTVNERTTSIYRDGPVSEAEKQEFETMRRSPYRAYLDGIYHEEDWIAFIRVIDTAQKITELAYEIAGVLPSGMFRMEIRPEAHFPGHRGIYFYDSKASIATMKQRVCEIMKAEAGEDLKPVDLYPRMTRYLPEHDALLLLGRLKSRYEPVSFFPKKKTKEKSSV